VSTETGEGQGLTYVELAAGFLHSLARRSDGSVVAWGNNFNGQCDVPDLPLGLTYIEIAAGYWHSLAMRSDGEVVAWGLNDYGQCDVPALPPNLRFVSLAAGGHYSLAIYGTSTDTASVSFRSAGTNPASYGAHTTPVLGGTYTAVVDLAGTTGHDLSILVGFASPLTLTLGGGQTLLVNISDSNGELLGMLLAAGPLATYDLPVPAQATFTGFSLSTQAMHFGSVQPWTLSNAQDLELGYR